MPTLRQLMMLKNMLAQKAAPTEQEVAHMIAQRHAALPTAQGGLGLPAANKPMDRAAAMGYELEKPLYRGTTANETKHTGNVWATTSPEAASYFAGESGNVMPLYGTKEVVHPDNAAPLWAGGERYQLPASELRSKHAAFDPMKRGSEDLMHAAGGEIRAFSGGGAKGKLIQAGLDMLIPKNTVKAYKLFRTNPEGDLHALYVNADKKFPIGEWIPAEIGQAAGNGKVKSSIGNLAFRPGLHAGSAPTATHIGGALGPRIDPKTGEYFMTKSGEIKKVPTERRPDEVWAEIDMPDDFDWQTIANERGINSKGILIPKNAHITDQIPVGGHYRYKTNPNMEGEWLIGGGMKINKVLTDAEVEAANRAAGVMDLPRTQPSVFPYERFDFNQPIAESSEGLEELLKYHGIK